MSREKEGSGDNREYDMSCQKTVWLEISPNAQERWHQQLLAKNINAIPEDAIACFEQPSQFKLRFFLLDLAHRQITDDNESPKILESRSTHGLFFYQEESSRKLAMTPVATQAKYIVEELSLNGNIILLCRDTKATRLQYTIARAMVLSRVNTLLRECGREQFPPHAIGQGPILT